MLYIDYAQRQRITTHYAAQEIASRLEATEKVQARIGVARINTA